MYVIECKMGVQQQAVLCSKDGRLCAAAFVQHRKSYTGCTDAPNPAGESGRPWCYVEAQVCWLLQLFKLIRLRAHVFSLCPALGVECGSCLGLLLACGRAV